MTQAQHTPGPWRYESTSGSNYARIFFSADEEDGDNLRGYCGEANARLIAAAPDLLEALQNMMAIVDDAPKGVASYYANGEDAPWSDFDREITAARAAIAKALGEPHR